MRQKTRYLLLFFFYSICGIAQTQQPLLKRLKGTDNIKSDSVAIHVLDSIKKNEKLTAKQELEVDLKILRRAILGQNFNKAILIGTEGLALAQKNGADSMEGAFNKLIGNSYYYMEQRKKALPYYKKAFEIAHGTRFWFLEANCSNNLGAILTDLNEYEGAEYYLQNSIKILEAHEQNNHDLYLTYRVLAALYVKLKQIDKAEAIYIKLIDKCKAIKDTTVLGGNLLYYSTLLKTKGDTAKAVAMSKEALYLLRHNSDFHSLIAGLRIHGANLADAKRYGEAYGLDTEAFNLLRKSYTKDLEKQISEVEVKYKTEQLQRDKELAEIKAKKEQQIYLLIFGAVLIVIIALFYILTQRKNTRQKIASQQQRLEAIIEGEEKERSRIAKDLHDGIVQDLTAIKLKVQSSGREDEFLNTVSSDIDRAAREVRNISYQMMPVALREYGLIRSLEDLLQKTLAPINIRFDFEPVNITERLPEKIEVCLYRITQELLNNVVKHSKADFVSLVISKRTDSISLIFEDNGAGFNQDDVKKGIGMSSLSSRLEIVNGELKFESAVGSGTMAIIKIPF